LPGGMDSVEDSTFEGCQQLEHIELPLGIAGIGRHAFKGCINLKTVYMPETLRRIDTTAFEDCDDVEVEVDHFGMCAVILRMQGIPVRKRC